MVCLALSLRTVWKVQLLECHVCTVKYRIWIKSLSSIKPNISQTSTGILIDFFLNSEEFKCNVYILKHSFRGNNSFLISSSMQIVQSLLLICNVHWQWGEPGLSGSMTEYVRGQWNSAACLIINLVNDYTEVKINIHTMRHVSNFTLMYPFALLSLCVIFLYDSTFFSKIWTLKPSSLCRVKKQNMKWPNANNVILK